MPLVFLLYRQCHHTVTCHGLSQIELKLRQCQNRLCVYTSLTYSCSFAHPSNKKSTSVTVGTFFRILTNSRYNRIISQQAYCFLCGKQRSDARPSSNDQSHHSRVFSRYSHRSSIPEHFSHL